MSRGNTREKNGRIVSAVRGALALVAGIVFVFCNTQRINILTTFMAVGLAILLIIDVFEIFYLKKAKKDLKFALINAAMELILVNLLFATLFPKIGEAITFGARMAALAIYALISSILTIIVAFKKENDSFARFSLAISGLIGTIVSLVMFFGKFYSTTYIMLLGLLLMVNGLAKLMLQFNSQKGEK